MKRTLSYSLALVLALCAFSAPPARAQIGTTCTITGTIYQVDGVTPAAGASLTVTRADKAGKLYANTSRVYTANSNGIITFKTPRTIGTDTAVIHVKASFGNLASGQILYVPSDSTATLESIVRYTANPQFVVVAVPTSANDSTQTIFDPSGTQKIPASRLDVGAITGDTTGTTNQPMQGRFEDALGQFTASTSDSLQQAQADAKLALNIGQGKAGADSVHTVLVTLSNLIAGKGGADSIHTALATLYDLVAGKPNADSVHTAIAAMLKMSDTTSLHAQRFAVINDSLFAISLRATSTANDLTAHASTADAHLPSQTGASGKFLQSNGTVSSWQTAVTTETDPTVAARIKDSLALYNLGIMRGDSAALTKVLDYIYPRSGGGGGLTNWDDTDTSATQASRTLKPKAYTANVNAVIRPLGTGAFIVGPPPDGTATGGNARGQNAVDLVAARTAAASVASGQYAFTAGFDGRATNAASVAVGHGNVSTGYASVAIGENTTASARGSIAAGRMTVALGAGSAALCQETLARGSHSHASGHYTAAEHRGEHIHFSGGTYPYWHHLTGGTNTRIKGGMSSLTLVDTTHNAVTDTLTIGASEGSASGRVWTSENSLTIDSGKVWTYSILVSARSDVGDAAAFKIEGAIKRVGATTSMVGTPTVTTIAADAAASTWAVNVAADDGADALFILVTGSDNKLIRWHAAVTLSIVGF